MQITDYLFSATERHPDKLALFHSKRVFTYHELYTAAQGIASWLNELHLDPGFRGAIFSDDPFEYITSYFGILQAGGIAVGLNTQTTDIGLAYVLNDCGASVLFFFTQVQQLSEKFSVPGTFAQSFGNHWDDWKKHRIIILCLSRIFPKSASTRIRHQVLCPFAPPAITPRLSILRVPLANPRVLSSVMPI